MSDEESEEDYTDASQMERDILQTLKDKYGTLPRDTFIEKITSECSQGDIDEYRKSLYGLALIDHEEQCPEGQLITRKDTQNIGGLTAAHKLADDVYSLVQFHCGDTTMDLTKLLSEKSKALLRKNIPTSNTQDTAAKIRQQGTSQSVNDESPANKPMLEFCRELLVEMRKDRYL